MISHGLCQQKRCILLKVPNYISVITRKVFLQLQNYNQAAKEKKKERKKKYANVFMYSAHSNLKILIYPYI